MTYTDECAGNWPRPTCHQCGLPCAYDREYRSKGLCSACYDQQPKLVPMNKEILCRTKSPS